MADKKFTFKDGITKIPGKKFAEAFYNYETVEIPGSVSEIKMYYNRFYEPRKAIVKNVILNEGTVLFQADIKGAKYNIPSSVTKIECNGIPPRIICLKEEFQQAMGEFYEVEYIQAYATSDLRLCDFRNLKHFVCLGNKMKNWQSQFVNLPSGCVIHVETKRAALSVLKKCRINEHFVVVDAAEWKDFPADKLALTMEEYNPKSRILPEQLQLQSENKNKQKEKKCNEQKNKMIEKMVDQVIRPVLAPLQRSGNMVFSSELKYCTSVSKDEKTGNTILTISAVIAKDIWDTGWNDNIKVVVKMKMEDVSTQSNILADHLLEVRDFIEENRDQFETYRIRIAGKNLEPSCGAPGINLPFVDRNIVARFNIDTYQEDIKDIIELVGQFEKLMKQGLEVFPLGFYVEAC